MNQVLGSYLMVSTRMKDLRTSKEMKLRACSVLAKIGLNEGGRETDLILTNLYPSWFFFITTRRKTHKNNSLNLESRVSFFHLGLGFLP